MGAFISIPGRGSAEWKPSVASAGSLPTTGQAGEVRLVQDVGQLFYWDGSAWQALTSGGGGGISSFNSQTGSSQSLATGTSGTDFNISSALNVHTFNIPDASGSARGLITTGAQTLAGDKTFSGTIIATLISYTPAVAGNWETVPDDVYEALDKLADKTKNETTLVGPVVLSDNSSGTAFSIAHSTYNYVVVEYSAARDSIRRTGRLLLATNGTDAVLTDDYVETSVMGLAFSAAVSGAVVNVDYLTTNTGFNVSFKYKVKRWI